MAKNRSASNLGVATMAPKIEDGQVVEIVRLLALKWASIKDGAGQVMELARKRVKEMLLEIFGKSRGLRKLSKPEKSSLATAIISKLKEIHAIVLTNGRKEILKATPALLIGPVLV